MKKRYREPQRMVTGKGASDGKPAEAAEVGAVSAESTVADGLSRLQDAVEESVAASTDELEAPDLSDGLGQAGEPAAEPDEPAVERDEAVDEAAAEGFSADEAGGYKAYGEPLPREQLPDKFTELEAMEELLSVDSEYGSLPHPDVFNAYPPEVQRKIMEWTDRDVRARRDDESRRKDELVRATIERDRRRQLIPAVVIIIAILCGAIVGFATGNPWFSAAFLLVPIFVIIAIFVSNNIESNRSGQYRKPPKV